MLTFFVPGIPAPGGSKKAFVDPKTRRIVVKDDAKNNKSWRERVASVAIDRMGDAPPLLGPLSVSFVFVVTRPAGHFGTGKNAGRVKPSAPPYPAVKPDTTKLIRAVEDALTGICWHDDAQIVNQNGIKVYGDRPGVRVEVLTMAELAELVGNGGAA